MGFASGGVEQANGEGIERGSGVGPGFDEPNLGLEADEPVAWAQSFSGGMTQNFHFDAAALHFAAEVDHHVEDASAVVGGVEGGVDAEVGDIGGGEGVEGDRAGDAASGGLAFEQDACGLPQEVDFNHIGARAQVARYVPFGGCLGVFAVAHLAAVDVEVECGSGGGEADHRAAPLPVGGKREMALEDKGGVGEWERHGQADRVGATPRPGTVERTLPVALGNDAVVGLEFVETVGGRVTPVLGVHREG